MFGLLVLLFIGVPLLEVALLVKLGTVIGFWETIALQVFTGFAGAALARWQGFMVWMRIQESLDRGEVPAGDAIDGLLILAAGLTMLTPGLITDATGFLLLFPPTRAAFKRFVYLKLKRAAERRSGHYRIDL